MREVVERGHRRKVQFTGPISGGGLVRDLPSGGPSSHNLIVPVQSPEVKTPRSSIVECGEPFWATYMGGLGPPLCVWALWI